MKMTNEHFEQLSALIVERAESVAKRNDKTVKQFLAEYRDQVAPVANDADMRVRWDLVWSIPFKTRSELFDQLYKYLNNDHIDTALRKIYNSLIK